MSFVSASLTTAPLQQQTSQSLELSLRRERTLTSQLQQRATTLQRSVEDLQQRLRVGESL